MSQNPTDPMQMVRIQIAEQAQRRSDAHYNLSKARLNVTQLEAVIAACDRELAVLEQTQNVLDRMNRQLAQQVAAVAPVAQPAPPLPVDGPSAHITQDVAAPQARRGAKPKATKGKSGRPPGRPKGSGRKPPEAIHDEPTVAGMNGAGLTPNQAVDMGR